MQKTLTFALEKETKGAIRYLELVEDKFAEPTVGTLYVRKSAFKDLGRFPQKITITIEVAS